MSASPRRGAALLDVNVLVALGWPSHVFHTRAHRWFAQHSSRGWATTPVTECGFVRVSSNRGALPLVTTPGRAVEALRRMSRVRGHTFWADDVRFVAEDGIVDSLRGYRQVTDAHSLSLAASHDGRLATFDEGIEGAHPAYRHLVEVIT